MEKAPDKKMFSPIEAARLFSTSAGTLAVLRHQKRGPRFYRVGSKILYTLDDLSSCFMSNSVDTEDSRVKDSVRPGAAHDCT